MRQYVFIALRLQKGQQKVRLPRHPDRARASAAPSQADGDLRPSRRWCSSDSGSARDARLDLQPTQHMLLAVQSNRWVRARVRIDTDDHLSARRLHRLELTTAAGRSDFRSIASARPWNHAAASYVEPAPRSQAKPARSADGSRASPTHLRDATRVVHSHRGFEASRSRRPYRPLSPGTKPPVSRLVATAS